jgi:GxxExxY protein
MFDAVSYAVIGAAIEVHTALGPGLLESLYERALVHEFGLRGIDFTRQVDMPACYKGIDLGGTYRFDLIAENSVVVEIKAVQQLLPVHRSQLLTYMRVGHYGVGLLLNFHAVTMKRGIVRMVR